MPATRLSSVPATAVLAIAAVFFACFAAVEIPTVAADCAAHADCASNEYCGEFGFCHACELCDGDAIDGNCPICSSLTVTTTCATHYDCAQTQYCDSESNCITCQACLSLDDGVDGFCPSWCGTPTGSSDAVNLSEQGSTGGNKSSGGVIAVAVIGALLIVGALVGAAWYVKYRKEKDEETLVEVNNALDAREQAQQTIQVLERRRSSMIIPLARSESRHSQQGYPGFNGVAIGESSTDPEDEWRGEYIDVDGTHSTLGDLGLADQQHSTSQFQPAEFQRRASNSFQPANSRFVALYDDEFLELARDMNVSV